MIRPAILVRGKVNLSKIVEFPDLENIEVTPTKEDQILKSEKYGFGEVIVKGDENLDPNNIAINTSIYGVQGTFDCDAKLDLATFIGSSNKKYEDLYNVLTGVNMSHIDLTGKTSLRNLFNGFSRLKDAVIDMKGITDTNYLFGSCTQLKDGHIKLYNTEDLEDTTFMFDGCIGLTETVEFDTSNVKHVSRMYQGCKNIITMKPMDFSSVIDMAGFFKGLQNLRNIEKVTNIGKGYTEKEEYYSQYDVYLYDASYLTSDAVLKVIEGLADLNEVYDVANGGTLYRQKLRLGTAHANKVTAAQKQIAIDKGWTVTS